MPKTVGSMMIKTLPGHLWAIRLQAVVFFIGSAATGQAMAKTIAVPLDFPTIKLAVANAQSGDSIEVGDGIYFESEIIVDKNVSIEAAHPYGAVIYGRYEPAAAIFIIRAEAEISGFVLKNSSTGIEQRLSPDVLWKARNLLVMDVYTGISVNDPSENVGRAALYSIIFQNCRSAISTNDAGGMEVSDCLIMNCPVAFAGTNHLYFRVAGTTLANSGEFYTEAWRFIPKPPATNSVVLGPGVETLAIGAPGEDGALDRFASVLKNHLGLTSATGKQGTTELRKRALMSLLIGLLLLETNSPADALRSFEEAYSLASRAESPEFKVHALEGMARSYERENQRERCLRAYREIIDLVEQIQAAIPAGLYSTNYVSDKIRNYERLIGCLCDWHTGNPGDGWAMEALAYSERSRGAGRFMLGGPRDDEFVVPQDLLEKGRLIEQEISGLQIGLTDPDISPQRIQALRASLEFAEDRYHGYLVEQQRALPSRHRQPLDADLNSHQGRVPDKTAIIEYFLGKERSFAFLLAGNEIAMTELPPRSIINELADNFLRLVKFGDLGDATLLRAGARLSGILLTPFERTLNSVEKLVIVPDSHLCFLPFGALAEYDGTHPRHGFVVERWEVEYAPSIAFYLTDSSSSSSSSSGSRALVLGAAGTEIDYRSPRYLRSFRPLKFVSQELDAVSEACKIMGLEPLINPEGLEGWFKALDLRRYGVIHFAGHGIIDDEKWWRSALILGRDKAGKDDGLLSPLEISQMRLKADLVVLSGCQTGLGRLYEGEGIKGLARSFLDAGARAVLVSLWNVDDRATAELMARFYENISRGMSPSQALKVAKTAMHRRPGAGAFIWAPFILIGDQGVSVRR